MISDLHEVPEVITSDFSAVLRESMRILEQDVLGSYPSFPVYKLVVLGVLLKTLYFNFLNHKIMVPTL